MEPGCENLSLSRFASISTSLVSCSLFAGRCKREDQLIKSQSSALLNCSRDIPYALHPLNFGISSGVSIFGI